MSRLAVGNVCAAQWKASGSRRSPPRSSALGRRRQPAVAGRRIERRRFNHTLAQARRQIGGREERRRAGKLGDAAVTATRAARARGASRTVAFFWQDVASVAAGRRVRVRTARDACASGGMPLCNMRMRVLARMLAVENRRTSNVARARVVVAVRSPRNRRPRALPRDRQEGDQAVGRRQTSPAAGSIRSHHSPSTRETRPGERLAPLPSTLGIIRLIGRLGHALHTFLRAWANFSD